MKVLLLHGRSIVLVTLPKNDIATETADLQKLVGGFLEVVPLADDAALLVDEDGLCKCLPVNTSASMLAGRPIVGDAVVVGVAKNEDGELYFTDVPQGLI